MILPDKSGKSEDRIAAEYLAIIRFWGYERAFRDELDCCFSYCSTAQQKRATYLWLVRHAAEQVRQKVKEDRARFGLPRGKEWLWELH